jgi:hypothetical protein
MNPNPGLEKVLVGRAAPSAPLDIKHIERSARWGQRALPVADWVKLHITILLSIGLLIGLAGWAHGEDAGLTITKSTYSVTKKRDPFVSFKQSLGASPSTKQVSGTQFVFRLDGILYQANDPAASINGTLVRLNRPVTIRTDTGEARVKAVEITREKVVLDVNGQNVELKIAASK